MKNKYITGLALTIIPLTLYAAATLRTDTGFYYPTDKKHSASSYFGFKDVNPFFQNKCHLANDYDYPEGTDIYSVGIGVVEFAKTDQVGYGSDFGAGGVMVIKHTKSDDTFFYGLYGHINNFAVAVGDTVVGGQKIAEVGTFAVGGVDQPHLHFGVNPNSNSIQGYTPSSACTEDFGFVDPEPYLVANSPKLLPAETCTAVNDSGNTAHNTILTTTSVLTNDTDTDGDTLTVSAGNSTSVNGIAVLNNGDGTFTYTPALDFSGMDTFNYTINDSNGCTSEATYTVTVAAGTVTTGNSGGGSLSISGFISLFIILLTRRFRRRF